MAASQHHPGLTDTEARSQLAVSAVGRLTPDALREFINRLHEDPDPSHVAMQMCQVLLLLGKDEFALEMQARALTHRRHYRVAGHPSPEIRLLALMGAGGMSENTPLDFVVDGIPVRLDWLFVLPGESLPDEIPDHDVLIVAVGETGRDSPALLHLHRWVEEWPRPVLNFPQCINRCARDVLSDLFHDVPGLRVPPTRRIGRDRSQPLRLPALMRPVGTHAGKGLERLDTRADFYAYLDAHPEPDFYVCDFVDYRSEDGLYRKLRIALIDRVPYVCHVVIGEHWMVHYKSARMEQSNAKRLEEAATMQSFDDGFAATHGAALRSIADALALDYVVIDCAESADGNLLLFEADTRGWIHATDPIETFPYKPAVMRKAFDAFMAMLRSRARSGFSSPRLLRHESDAVKRAAANCLRDASDASSQRAGSDALHIMAIALAGK